jgi:osmotically-inducible protein OsmY
MTPLPSKREVPVRTSRAFLIGIGTAYFFDPRLGRRRRHVVRDRGRRAARNVTRILGGKARFGADKTHGLYARGRRLVVTPEVSTDDAVVEQRIRSEAFRDVGIATGAVELDVEDGVASLTGSVPDDRTASQLVSRVSKVAGVEEVAAMLHVRKDDYEERLAS